MGVSLPISCEVVSMYFSRDAELIGLAGCWNRVPIIGTLVNPPVSEKNPRPQRIKLSLILMLLFGFGFTNGYEMMHKAWSSIGEVTYCFSRSCVKFQGHTGQKIAVFDPNRAFPDYNFSLNSPMALKLCATLFGIEEVLYCFSKSSIEFQCHTGQKITNFYPNWAFPDCNSSLTSPMDLKWCTKLDVVYKKCPIVFRGHPSNFTTTQAEKSTICIQFTLLGRSQLSNPPDLHCFCIGAIMIRY